jgi:SAM-dependent methyltransferase
VSLERLAEHRQIWRRKPLLGDVYAPWFEALLREVPPGGRALEVGAGPGFLAPYARARAGGAGRLVSVDLLPAPWNAASADAQSLPFVAGAFDAVLALDVLHHLSEPARFFEESVRVLKPSGRIAVVEPWVTPFSYPIYKWLHEETCRSGLDHWRPFAAGPDKQPFEGDGGIFTQLIRRTSDSQWRQLGLEPPRLCLLNCMTYVLSLGFRGASLLPRALAPAVMTLDRWLAPAAPLLALRAVVVWQRR